MFTNEQVLEAIFKYRNAETGNPYECVYTTKDGRHCIVGQILEDFGLPMPEDNGIFTENPNAMPFIELADYYPEFNDDQIKVLRELQSICDSNIDGFDESVTGNNCLYLLGENDAKVVVNGVEDYETVERVTWGTAINLLEREGVFNGLRSV